MLNGIVSVEGSIHALLSLHEFAKYAGKITLKSDMICWHFISNHYNLP